MISSKCIKIYQLLRMVLLFEVLMSINMNIKFVNTMIENWRRWQLLLQVFNFPNRTWYLGISICLVSFCLCKNLVQDNYGNYEYCTMYMYGNIVWLVACTYTPNREMLNLGKLGKLSHFVRFHFGVKWFSGFKHSSFDKYVRHKWALIVCGLKFLFNWPITT